MELIVEFKKLETDEEIIKTKELIGEYIKWLNQDLSYQDIDEELQKFPEKYREPFGTFIIAKVNENVIGCVGLKKLDDKICEMKRLYVHDNYKGKGIGKKLTELIIQEAKTKNYEKMRLDTFNIMEVALKIYYENGFQKINSYYNNPNEGVIYLEKIL